MAELPLPDMELPARPSKVQKAEASPCEMCGRKPEDGLVRVRGLCAVED